MKFLIQFWRSHEEITLLLSCCNMFYVMPDFKFWNTPIQLYCRIWIWKIITKLETSDKQVAESNTLKSQFLNKSKQRLNQNRRWNKTCMPKELRHCLRFFWNVTLLRKFEGVEFQTSCFQYAICGYLAFVLTIFRKMFFSKFWNSTSFSKSLRPSRYLQVCNYMLWTYFSSTVKNTMLNILILRMYIVVPYYCSNGIFKGESSTAAISKMETFVIIVYGWKPLTIITKSSTLDVAVVLDPSLIFIIMLTDVRVSCFSVSIGSIYNLISTVSSIYN